MSTTTTVTAPAVGTTTTNGAAKHSLEAAAIAVLAAIVPPGILLAPFAALAAVVLGIVGVRGARPGTDDRGRSLLAIGIGTVLLVTIALALYLFRNVIGDALSDAGAEW